ncbi:MAG: hypothetical protein AYP45_12095 [Candidatus Brocadia carolinensis]|uniref:Uncharacterized protein n=1 Tax=Candidatus Brocadia carolinensis TaxID=1004156 RepID=A0A1V4AS05_9BACT|nr:MAG: hypothetical protein AYP45_12095 [Candidatus Brocadia caroliniensis]
MSEPAVTPDRSADQARIAVPQGPRVLFWGIFGSLLGSAPALLLLPGVQGPAAPWNVLAPLLWACFVGWPITHYWSASLHDRITLLRKGLITGGWLSPEEQKQYPGRVPWVPAWIGLFERPFFALPTGLDVHGGAAFIGVWIGIKLAGGWQVWSRGSTYGRAILFAGILENAMSVIFGVVAGCVIRVALKAA